MWHKLLAIVMSEQGITEFEITSPMIDRLARAGLVIVADVRGGKLVLRLVPEAEGLRMTREWLGTH